MLVSKSFHKYVRGAVNKRREEEHQQERDALLATVASNHKSVVNNLMDKIGKFKNTTSNATIVDECHRLLLVYIKLAQSLKVKDQIATHDYDLHEKIMDLHKENRSPIEEERLARLIKHRELRRKNSADYECIRQQLHSIQELIEYTLEKSVSFPPNLTKIRVSLNESSMETSISEEVLKEMEEFAGIDEHTVLS